MGELSEHIGEGVSHFHWECPFTTVILQVLAHCQRGIFLPHLHEKQFSLDIPGLSSHSLVLPPGRVLPQGDCQASGLHPSAELMCQRCKGFDVFLLPSPPAPHWEAPMWVSVSVLSLNLTLRGIVPRSRLGDRVLASPFGSPTFFQISLICKKGVFVELMSRETQVLRR